ncbi:MAG: sulfite exporter TauE/SafE family protein [Mailhella sp.]|nr:sulfite exporter TauE/SafE family protein [Mailhella sp.]
MEFAWICFVVALGWFLGGIVGGSTGIGAIMVAMPLLTAVLSPLEAVLVSCLVGVYATLHMAWAYRKSCCWKDIRDLVVGSVPGCVLGGLVLKIASMQTLQLMVCFMLVCFVTMQMFRRFASYRLPESSVIGMAAGSVCGFVSASVAMVGAPLGIYVLLKGWDPDRARGNMSGFYVFTSAGAAIMQASAGLYTMPLFQIALAGIVGCFAGNVVGVWLGRRVDQVLFKRIVLAFLAFAAVTLFWRAVG